jgi:hypothetical protein
MNKKISCSKFKKAECKSPCKWNKRCIKGSTSSRSKSSIQERKSAPKRGVGCSKFRKADCKSPCKWNKRCVNGSASSKSKSPVQMRKSPERKMIKKSAPKNGIGCSKFRKADCKSPCKWNKRCVKGSASSKSKSPSQERRSPIYKKDTPEHKHIFNIDDPKPDIDSPIYAE